MQECDFTASITYKESNFHGNCEGWINGRGKVNVMIGVAEMLELDEIEWMELLESHIIEPPRTSYRVNGPKHGMEPKGE